MSQSDQDAPVEQTYSDKGPVGRVVSVLNALGSVGILGLMVLINADIFGRAFMNRPIAGVPEMVSFSIVGIVFLQLAHTLRAGSLTRSDMLLEILKRHTPMGHRLLLGAFNLIGAALLTIVIIRFWPEFWKAYTHPERHFMGNPGFFTLVQWPLYAFMLVGMAAAIVQFLACALTALRGETKTDTPVEGTSE